MEYRDVFCLKNNNNKKNRLSSAKNFAWVNPCPAEPGYIPPLQTVDPDQLASEEAN